MKSPYDWADLRNDLEQFGGAVSDIQNTAEREAQARVLRSALAMQGLADVSKVTI